MYVCMFVCMYVCMYVCMSVCEITACHRTFSGEKHYLSVHVYICTEIMSG